MSRKIAPDYPVYPKLALALVYTPPKRKDHPPPRLLQFPTEYIVTISQAPEVSQLAGGVRAERYRLSIRLKKGVPLTGTFVHR